MTPLPEPVRRFLDAPAPGPMLGLLTGRRRLGKTTLLAGACQQRGGLLWEAAPLTSQPLLDDLAAALGRRRVGAPVPLPDWRAAVAQLFALGAEQPTPVVLDDAHHLIAAEPSLPALLAEALGAADAAADAPRPRVILCGSGLSTLRALTARGGALRGRARLRYAAEPADARVARTWLPAPDDLPLAARVHAILGGVRGHHTSLVADDLPETAEDFDRWVTTRVLHPSAALHQEVEALLADDPALAANLALHRSVLAAIATGAERTGAIAQRLAKPTANVAPLLQRLVEAGLVDREDDPLRAQRPSYVVADPLVRFHFAVLAPHRALLHAGAVASAWRDHLSEVFDARVRQPALAAGLRAWARRHAEAATLGGGGPYLGRGRAPGAADPPLDLVVARDTAGTGDDEATPPAEREVAALGRAILGTAAHAHLRSLEQARADLGRRAQAATLVVGCEDAEVDLRAEADRRGDVALVDLARLHHGT